MPCARASFERSPTLVPAATLPAFATAPALLFVATLMMRELIEIDWEDVTEAAPAALTAIMMPFTYSIANGIMFGVLTWMVLRIVRGKIRDIHPVMWIVFALFVIRIVTLVI